MYRFRPTLGVLFFLAVGCLCQHHAHGLSLKKPTTAQLLQSTDWIVKATMYAERSLQTKGGFPLRRTTFHIKHTYKGRSQTSITTQLPGTNNALSSFIPRFEKGKTYILFLRKNRVTPYPLLVALYFGVMDIQTKKGVEWVRHRGKLFQEHPLRTFEKTLTETLKKLQSTQQLDKKPAIRKRTPTSSVPPKKPTTKTTKGTQ